MNRGREFKPMSFFKNFLNISYVSINKWENEILYVYYNRFLIASRCEQSNVEEASKLNSFYISRNSRAKYLCEVLTCLLHVFVTVC